MFTIWVVSGIVQFFMPVVSFFLLSVNIIWSAIVLVMYISIRIIRNRIDRRRGYSSRRWVRGFMTPIYQLQAYMAERSPAFSYLFPERRGENLVMEGKITEEQRRILSQNAFRANTAGVYYAICRHCGRGISKEEYSESYSVFTSTCDSLTQSRHDWVIAAAVHSCRYCRKQIAGKDLQFLSDRVTTTRCAKSPTGHHYWE